MKIIESNGKKTIKISKKEWEEIGKRNNWKIAQEGEPVRLTPNDTKIIFEKTRSFLFNLGEELHLMGYSGPFKWHNEGIIEAIIGQIEDPNKGYRNPQRNAAPAPETPSPTL